MRLPAAILVALACLLVDDGRATPACFEEAVRENEATLQEAKDTFDAAVRRAAAEYDGAVQSAASRLRRERLVCERRTPVAPPMPPAGAKDVGRNRLQLSLAPDSSGDGRRINTTGNGTRRRFLEVCLGPTATGANGEACPASSQRCPLGCGTGGSNKTSNSNNIPERPDALEYCAGAMATGDNGEKCPPDTGNGAACPPGCELCPAGLALSPSGEGCRVCGAGKYSADLALACSRSVGAAFTRA